ncbi:MAG: hypothetical protein MUE40_09180 [Anaerolineae bacterium]|jgi:hypothetical protein|nr:hypothetical protein [Anaerolineae bacterium]
MATTPAERYAAMTHYLRIFYSEPFYRYGGITHPVLWHPAPPPQQHDLNSVLGRWYPAPRREYPLYDHGYLHSLQNSGRSLYDGVTFSLKTLTTRPLRLNATLGSYFDMLATCGALERELRDAAGDAAIRLPGRSQYHRQVAPALALKSGRGRSAAIGGACLVVFKHQGRYQALLARRSPRNATDPGFFHLLPAFIFQPASADVRPEEWNIERHIYRELLEELFGLPEQEQSPPPPPFDDHPALVYLRHLLATGGAGLYLTGVVLGLLTLRPEICALLLIHDEAWYERITAPDSDMPLNAAHETDGGITLVPIDSDAALLAALPPDVHTIMPPQAVAALWEGVALARQHIAGRA